MLAMLVTSGVLFGIFFVVEWRLAKLPMLPAHLFNYGCSTNILIFINVLIGWIFWGNLFCIPLYLQNIRGFTPGQAGLFMLPMVIAHGLTSALTGLLISLCGHYKPIVVTGAICWAIAAVIKLRYDQSTPIWTLVVIGMFDGVGVGCSLQPGMSFCQPRRFRLHYLHLHSTCRPVRRLGYQRPRRLDWPAQFSTRHGWSCWCHWYRFNIFYSSQDYCLTYFQRPVPS